MRLLLVFGFCLAVLPDAAAANAPTVLTVGVYQNPPKVFLSDAAKPSGIFIDILQAIAEAEGWELRYESVTWREGLERLEAGTLDLMPDVAYSADRALRFSFHTIAVLSDWFQVYAPRVAGIHSILDLDGKRVAVLEHSIQETTFLQMAEGFGLDATLISLPDYATVFTTVAEGAADAAIANRFYGARGSQPFGVEDTAVIFHPTSLFFAASKTLSPSILDAIDRHLQSMKQDAGSAYHAALRRWTSEAVRFRLPSWVRNAGLLALAILLATFAASVVLKRQVNARTRELKTANREMEQRIAERTEELAEAMEKARESDHLKSAFLATMSHELRTPLNVIIGFTGILLQELAGPLTEEQRKQLTMVQGSARHLLALINDVLDISKIEAGQLELYPETFDPKESVEKVAHLIRPMAEEKGLELHLDLDPTLNAATADQRRFEQILLNLLNNAVKFTEKGHVRVSCRREGETLVLALADTGIGIAPSDVAILFRPFTQVDTGLSRKHEGTGLGLSICQKLTALMGGTIAVESRLGEGSTFTVRIPLAPGGGTP